MKRWILLDATHNTYASDFQIDQQDLGVSERCSVSMRRLQVGLSEGVDVIDVVTNGVHCVMVPTRGMGLWRASVGGKLLGWQSPVRFPVHPKFVNLAEPDGLGFLTAPNELMFRCGLGHAGAPELDETDRLRYPLHGRIANLPAHYVEVQLDTREAVIVVRGEVDEVRFLQQKLRLCVEYRIPLIGSSVRWTDRVENLSGHAARMQVIYHVNIGQPLLQPGWELVAPVMKLCPRDQTAAQAGAAQSHICPPEDPDSWEQVYFHQMHADPDGTTQVMLRDPSRSRGVGLTYNSQQLPYFTQWRNTQASADGYVTGIEPGTNFPNPHGFEERHGRIVSLGPHAAWSTTLELEVFNSPQQILEAHHRIEAQRAGRAPQISDQPDPNWSPHG